MKYIAMALLTAAFVGWLAWSGQADAVASALAALPASALLLLFCGLAGTYLLRALRVFHEFRDRTAGRFWACLRLVLTHNALVNLLPMRSGELAFPVLLQREFGVPVARAAGSLLWLRMQDAIILALLAVAGWPGLAAPLRAAGIVLLLLGGALLPLLAHWLLARVPSGRISKFCAVLADSARHARIGWLWTLANWTVKLAVLAEVLALLLGTNFATGLAGAVGGELAAISPVQGVAGFGSYEAGVAAPLALSGVGWSSALKAAFSLHLLVLASALSAAGLALALSTIFRNRAASGNARASKPLQEP